MARRIDFYNFNPTNNPNWVPVAFPETTSQEIPAKTGIYRFVCCQTTDRQTLFADDTYNSIYGKTLRACYYHHSSMHADNGDELFELYTTQGVEFEHYQCDEQEAKEHKQLLVSKFKPHYNSVKFIIREISIKTPFDH